MSAFRVTPRARDDLKNIGRYTEQQWGKIQRNIYLEQLEKRFGWLAENPLLGKQRPDIAEGYYSFPQGEHVVFYLVGKDSIDIIGIPHKNIASGGTRKKVEKNMKEAIEFHLEGLTMEKQKIPVEPIGRLYGALQHTGSFVTLEEMEEAVSSGACESGRP